MLLRLVLSFPDWLWIYFVTHEGHEGLELAVSPASAFHDTGTTDQLSSDPANPDDPFSPK